MRYFNVQTFFLLHVKCKTCHTRLPASKQAHIHANRNHLPILTKIKRCFSPVSDISTIKRTFHCIMHAKTWYTRFPASKYAQTHANRNHSPILTKIQRCIPPFQIFRRLNALFTAICLWNAVHAVSSVETIPDTHKSHSFADFDEN